MPDDKPDFNVETDKTQGTSQADCARTPINNFNSNRKQWLMPLLFFIVMLVSWGAASWYFNSPFYDIRNSIFWSDHRTMIETEGSTVGIQDSPNLIKTFPGEFQNTFKNRPPVIWLETLASESRPDMRIIRGEDLRGLQIPKDDISVKAVFYHEDLQQEVTVPVQVREFKWTGLISIEFEITVQGLPQLSRDAPGYSAPFFAFRMTDQAGNQYFQKQTYAQFMTPVNINSGYKGLTRVKLEELKVEKLPEGKELQNDSIQGIATEMPVYQQLENGEPAILMEVKNISHSRQLKWSSNVRQRKPVSLVFRDNRQIGMSFSNEFTDDKVLDTDTVIYVIEQEGKDGTKYRSSDTEFTNEPVPISVADSNSLGMGFVHIKPGSFMMGSSRREYLLRDKDEKLHSVTLSRDFYMQTTEVTQQQWKAVMGENPSRFKVCGGDCPVENVSWDDVQKFIKKLNKKEGGNYYRLPTEAEWEYACRAGSSTLFSFGDERHLFTDYAWLSGNSGRKPHPVGKRRPNAWGLYDMHGNVAEWCQDKCYADVDDIVMTDTYKNDIMDPVSLKGSHRVIRGGSYDSSFHDYRSANRTRSLPGVRDGRIGFRLVRSPTP